MQSKKELTIYITKDMVIDDLMNKCRPRALNKEDFVLKFAFLLYDESLFNQIQELAKYANNIVAKLSDDPYDDKRMDNVNSCIWSVIFKNQENKSNLFTFATDLYVRLVTGHYKVNGNKRFAYAFLVELLWYFGYYFKFTKGKDNHYEWNQKMLLPNISNNKIDSIKHISEWIYHNVMFAWKYSMNKNKKNNQIEHYISDEKFKFTKERAELMKQEPWYDDFVDCIKKLGKD